MALLSSVVFWEQDGRRTPVRLGDDPELGSIRAKVGRQDAVALEEVSPRQRY